LKRSERELDPLWRRAKSAAHKNRGALRRDIICNSNDASTFFWCLRPRRPTNHPNRINQLNQPSMSAAGWWMGAHESEQNCVNQTPLDAGWLWLVSRRTHKKHELN